MKQQPGVMLYFDIRPCLARLTMDQQGQLFNAILNYGELGIEPDFDYMLGIAWDFIKPRLERDKERYEDVCEKRRQAVLSRWEQSRDDTSEYKCIQTIPTATPTVTPAPASTSSSTARTTPAEIP